MINNLNIKLSRIASACVSTRKTKEGTNETKVGLKGVAKSGSLDPPEQLFLSRTSSKTFYPSSSEVVKRVHSRARTKAAHYLRRSIIKEGLSAAPLRYLTGDRRSDKSCLKLKFFEWVIFVRYSFCNYTVRFVQKLFYNDLSVAVYYTVRLYA